MTYHLASLRLRSIGERSARFRDVSLDLTAPADGVDEPSDSVVWLRNGGGKSSLLSLFFALLLPHASDFMGRAVKRSLTDYVDAGDTSHTIGVWHSVEDRTLLGEPGRVLITGAIYEWHDLRRPADPDQDRDLLQPSWYALYAVPGVIDETSLPLLDAEGRPLRRVEVIEALRALARDHADQMDLSVPKNQREWSQELQDRGIDPELYRRQKEMNHVEGGVEDLFRFSSAREFIDFLLDLTVSPQETTTIATRLAAVADLLATKPAKTLEHDFCRQAGSGLDRITVAAATLACARETAQAAADRAADLAARFSAAIELAQEHTRVTVTLRQTAEESLEQAGQDQTKAADLARQYRLRAAELTYKAAQEAQDEAGRIAIAAARKAGAWRLTPQLAEQINLDAQLRAVLGQAREERRTMAPLRRTVDRHSAALLTRYGHLAAELDAAADEAAVNAQRVRDQANQHEQAAKAAQTKVNDAIERAASAQTRLDDLSQDVRDAVEAGLLSSPDNDPHLVLGSAKQRRDELGSDLDDIRKRRGERPEQRRSLLGRRDKAVEEHVHLDSERTQLVQARDGFAQQARDLEGDPRIRDLAEATDAAPVDVWAEAETLRRRLHQEIASTDENLIRLEAIRLDERRTLDGQERTGVLPTSLDAARVIAVLEERGVEAESGWQHLLTLCPPARLGRALTHQRLARLGCGVVVPTNRVGEARKILAALGDATTTALVGLYSAAVATELLANADNDTGEEESTRPAWTGLHSGLVDSAIAQSEANAIRGRQTSLDVDQTHLVQRREHDRGLVDRLHALLSVCPADHLESLSRQVTQIDDSLQLLVDAAKQLQRQLDDLDTAEDHDRQAENAIIDQITDLSTALTRLQALAEAAAQRPTWLSYLHTALSDRSQADRDLQNHQSRQREAYDEAAASDVLARQNRQSAADYRTDAAAITFLEERPEAPADDPSVPVDSLRQSLSQARSALEVQASQSVLAERERSLRQRLAEVGEGLAAADPEQREEVAGLLAGPDGQTASSRARAIGDAEQAQRAAERALGGAEAERRGAQEQLEELQQRRTTWTELPVGADDPQQAEGLALAQDRAADDASQRARDAQAQLEDLDRQDGQARRRAEVFSDLLTRLPTPIAPGAVFEGDEDQARRRTAESAKVLQEEQMAVHAAQNALTNAVGDIRAVAGTYSAVTTTARERILHDPVDALAANASTLAANVKLRADMIEGELKGISEDQAIITTSLAHLVADTLGTLRKAERYSRLPESLGPWAGKKMLRIAFTDPPGTRELHAYIDRVIERRVTSGVKPQGMPLLKDAVHEAVGPRGFTVRVLKPTQDVAAISEDITRLGKWSGGEKLTVCVALYCTLAALRARNTGRGDAAGGVLVLDNPIGRASADSLVQLQRDVAAAHGVQLVYTTGVKDPEAVTLFPNVIRLDNRPGRTRSRRYIVHDQTDSPSAAAGDGEVTGIRVAHDTQARQPSQAEGDELTPVADE